jgi:hypothetical protein
VIAGNSHDDYRFVVAIDYDFGPGPLTAAQYPGAVARMLNLPLADPFVATVLDKYPLSNYSGSAPIALGAAGTDRALPVPRATAICRWLDGFLPMRTSSTTNMRRHFRSPGKLSLGAYHSAEVLYLLSTHLLNAEQRRLSSVWIRY